MNNTSAIIWSAELTRSVRTPPMRSHTNPEATRLTMPNPSISDSI